MIDSVADSASRHDREHDARESDGGAGRVGDEELSSPATARHRRHAQTFRH